jgi:thiamine phosphate synthase YjbQ (UPF0047 family)
VESETRTYRTGGDEVVLDLTRDAAEVVAGRGDGLLHVFVPHATAGIAIIETVPVLDGRLALGTWQSICLVDLNVDNAERSVRWSFLEG